MSMSSGVLFNDIFLDSKFIASFSLLQVCFIASETPSECNIYTRSTQRVQTSLAKADHYSHILPTVKMLSFGCERLPPPLKKKKVLDHYLHHDLGMLPLLRCFFLLI